MEPLPCIRSGNRFVPRSEIFNFLKHEFADLDAGLGLEVKAEAHAFASLLLVELEHCLDVIRYADEEHWWKVTYPELVRNLPPPFGRLVARKMRRDALQRLQVHGKQNAIKLAVDRAKQAYQALSNRLGDNKWVLNTPGASTVDALLFGHMCQARFEPLLCELLVENEDFSNLDAHYRQTLNRLRQSRFFSTSKPLFQGPELEMVMVNIPTRYARLESEDEEKKDNNVENAKQDGEVEVIKRERGLLEAGLFALGAVLAYMSWNEMFFVMEVDNNEDYEE